MDKVYGTLSSFVIVLVNCVSEKLLIIYMHDKIYKFVIIRNIIIIITLNFNIILQQIQ